jgi:hypothetical protein
VLAAEQEADKVVSQLDDCARRILAQRVPDITLLAEVSYWALWTTNLNAPDADQRLARGPDNAFEDESNEDCICTEALAALLKGIRDLAGSGSTESALIVRSEEY